MIDSMKKLLVEKYWKNIGDSVELEEKQAQMKVSITGLPNKGLKISIPAGGKVHTAMIENKEGYKKSCDYLLLIPCENFTDVYFIEMKKTLRSEEGSIQQIRSTIPVWDYLASMVKIRFSEKSIIKKHFVVIANKTGKQKTRFRSRYEYKSAGNKFRVIHSLKEIPFKELRCRNPS